MEPLPSLFAIATCVGLLFKSATIGQVVEKLSTKEPKFLPPDGFPELQICHKCFIGGALSQILLVELTAQSPRPSS